MCSTRKCRCVATFGHMLQQSSYLIPQYFATQVLYTQFLSFVSSVLSGLFVLVCQVLVPQQCIILSYITVNHQSYAAIIERCNIQHCSSLNTVYRLRFFLPPQWRILREFHVFHGTPLLHTYQLFIIDYNLYINTRTVSVSREILRTERCITALLSPE